MRTTILPLTLNLGGSKFSSPAPGVRMAPTEPLPANVGFRTGISTTRSAPLAGNGPSGRLQLSKSDSRASKSLMIVSGRERICVITIRHRQSAKRFSPANTSRESTERLFQGVYLDFAPSSKRSLVFHMSGDGAS